MALKNIKVLELAGLAPAPYCGMVLSDFGASIIRIDKVGAMDVSDAVSNGKKSIALNLKDHRGVEIFRKLCSTSDVIIEPFRKGVMEKLGLGPEILLNDNPKLVYARLSGFGQYGYYSDMAGHDINYLSITGLLSLFGWRNKHPSPPANFAELSSGSLLCVVGILLALIERHTTGRGQVIDANITESMSYAGTWLARSQNMMYFGQDRGKNWLDGGSHFYDTYETKDGRFMAVGAIEPQFYNELITRLELSHDDVPQFGDFENCRIILQRKFREKTQAEWCKIFDQTDACATPVLTLQEATEHRHNVERESFLKDNDGLVIAKPAPRMSNSPGVTHALEPKPLIGEHTEGILSNLGYSHSEIEELLKLGIAQVACGRCKH